MRAKAVMGSAIVPGEHEVQFTCKPALYVPASHEEHDVAALRTPVWYPTAQPMHASSTAVGA